VDVVGSPTQPWPVAPGARLLVVVMAVEFDATADTMLNAVCHFSDVPVHRA
jgi:hypothetical protein